MLDIVVGSVRPGQVALSSPGCHFFFFLLLLLLFGSVLRCVVHVPDCTFHLLSLTNCPFSGCVDQPIRLQTGPY